MSVNPTYKGLDERTRVSGLAITQWAQLAISLVVAIVFAIYLSPLPLGPTISIAVLVAGLPVAASYAFAGAEFSAVWLIANIWSFIRSPRRFLPGPGTTMTGYCVAAAGTETLVRRRVRRPARRVRDQCETESVIEAWQG